MTDIAIIPTLEDNYTYVFQSENKCVLVDCGEAKPVMDFLRQQKITPHTLLLTHHHGDHIAGIGELAAAWPDLKIYAPEKDLYRIPSAQIGLSDQEILDIDGLKISCIETRGHTQNHLCYYVESLQALFSGDTLFSMGCGRLFEGSPEDMYQSLQKLKSLPADTQIYCGHEYTLANGRFCLGIEPENGDIQNRLAEAQQARALNRPTLPVNLQTELETNVFLRAKNAETFAQLRKQRDSF